MTSVALGACAPINLGQPFGRLGLLRSSPENLQTGLHAGMYVGLTKLGFSGFPEMSAEGRELLSLSLNFASRR
jgi:hypothetical protein